MFLRKKGKMDESKKTDQEQVEELTDDQLEGVAGGAGFRSTPRGEQPETLEIDQAYDKYEDMPEPIM